MIAVIEVDHVIANEMDSYSRATQDFVKPRPKRGAAALVSPDPHIRGKKRNKCVQITGIDRNRVPECQLLNGQKRLQAVEALLPESCPRPERGGHRFIAFARSPPRRSMSH
jgi:hypothetical protein